MSRQVYYTDLTDAHCNAFKPIYRRSALAERVASGSIRNVSIHAPLHQQGEHMAEAGRSLGILVSIHAPLHQQGEPTYAEVADRLGYVSIHAPLHQQGERMCKMRLSSL